MARHAHRDRTSGQFAPIPRADTSVDNRSGDVQAEHDEPSDRTHYAPGRRLPDGAATVIDATTGEELASNPGHGLVPDQRYAVRAAHLAAAEGDPVTEFLLGGEPDGAPVDGPPRDTMHPQVVRSAMRGHGRARVNATGGTDPFR